MGVVLSDTCGLMKAIEQAFIPCLWLHCGTPRLPEWCQKGSIGESQSCLPPSIRLTYREFRRVTDGTRTRDVLIEPRSELLGWSWLADLRNLLR
jgi:hypothetical protein